MLPYIDFYRESVITTEDTEEVIAAKLDDCMQKLLMFVNCCVPPKDLVVALSEYCKHVGEAFEAEEPGADPTKLKQQVMEQNGVIQAIRDLIPEYPSQDGTPSNVSFSEMTEFFPQAFVKIRAKDVSILYDEEEHYVAHPVTKKPELCRTMKLLLPKVQYLKRVENDGQEIYVRCRMPESFIALPCMVPNRMQHCLDTMFKRLFTEASCNEYVIMGVDSRANFVPDTESLGRIDTTEPVYVINDNMRLVRKAVEYEDINMSHGCPTLMSKFREVYNEAAIMTRDIMMTDLGKEAGEELLKDEKGNMWPFDLDRSELAGGVTRYQVVIRFSLRNHSYEARKRPCQIRCICKVDWESCGSGNPTLMRLRPTKRSIIKDSLPDVECPANVKYERMRTNTAGTGMEMRTALVLSLTETSPQLNSLAREAGGLYKMRHPMWIKQGFWMSAHYYIATGNTLVILAINDGNITGMLEQGVHQTNTIQRHKRELTTIRQLVTLESFSQAPEKLWDSARGDAQRMNTSIANGEIVLVYNLHYSMDPIPTINGNVMARVIKINSECGWIDARLITHLVANAVPQPDQPLRELSVLYANEYLTACFGQAVRNVGKDKCTTYRFPTWCMRETYESRDSTMMRSSFPNLAQILPDSELSVPGDDLYTAAEDGSQVVQDVQTVVINSEDAMRKAPDDIQPRGIIRTVWSMSTQPTINRAARGIKQLTKAMRDMKSWIASKARNMVGVQRIVSDEDDIAAVAENRNEDMTRIEHYQTTRNNAVDPEMLYKELQGKYRIDLVAHETVVIKFLCKLLQEYAGEVDGVEPADPEDETTISRTMKQCVSYNCHELCIQQCYTCGPDIGSIVHGACEKHIKKCKGCSRKFCEFHIDAHNDCELCGKYFRHWQYEESRQETSFNRASPILQMFFMGYQELIRHWQISGDPKATDNEVTRIAARSPRAAEILAKANEMFVRKEVPLTGNLVAKSLCDNMGEYILKPPEMSAEVWNVMTQQSRREVRQYQESKGRIPAKNVIRHPVEGQATLTVDPAAKAQWQAHVAEKQKKAKQRQDEASGTASSSSTRQAIPHDMQVDDGAIAEPEPPDDNARAEMKRTIQVVNRIYANKTIPAYNVENTPDEYHVFCALITKHARGLVLTTVLEEDLPCEAKKFDLPGYLDPKRGGCQLGDFVLVVNPDKPEEFDVQYIKEFGSIVVGRDWMFPLKKGTTIMIVRPSTGLGYTPLHESVEVMRYRPIRSKEEDPTTGERGRVDAYEIRYQAIRDKDASKEQRKFGIRPMFRNSEVAGLQAIRERQRTGANLLEGLSQSLSSSTSSEGDDITQRQQMHIVWDKTTPGYHYAEFDVMAEDNSSLVGDIAKNLNYPPGVKVAFTVGVAIEVFPTWTEMIPDVTDTNMIGTAICLFKVGDYIVCEGVTIGSGDSRRPITRLTRLDSIHHASIAESSDGTKPGRVIRMILQFSRPIPNRFDTEFVDWRKIRMFRPKMMMPSRCKIVRLEQKTWYSSGVFSTLYAGMVLFA